MNPEPQHPWFRMLRPPEPLGEIQSLEEAHVTTYFRIFQRETWKFVSPIIPVEVCKAQVSGGFSQSRIIVGSQEKHRHEDSSCFALADEDKTSKVMSEYLQESGSDWMSKTLMGDAFLTQGQRFGEQNEFKKQIHRTFHLSSWRHGTAFIVRDSYLGLKPVSAPDSALDGSYLLPRVVAVQLDNILHGLLAEQLSVILPDPTSWQALSDERLDLIHDCGSRLLDFASQDVERRSQEHGEDERVLLVVRWLEDFKKDLDTLSCEVQDRKA